MKKIYIAIILLNSHLAFCREDFPDRHEHRKTSLLIKLGDLQNAKHKDAAWKVEEAKIIAKLLELKRKEAR